MVGDKLLGIGDKTLLKAKDLGKELEAYKPEDTVMLSLLKEPEHLQNGLCQSQEKHQL